MRPVRIAIPAASASSVVPLDMYSGRGVSLAVVALDGVIDVTLQYTLDDVYSSSFNPATAQWFALGAAGIAAVTQRNLADSGGAPIAATGVRALNAGAGTAVLQVSELGIQG
jgi:hypothetical protein